jgi:prolipoprotein diacylglyceryltransferase
MGPALLGPCIGLIFFSEGTIRERVWKLAKLCGAVFATVLITSRWVYWHNFELYGDVTGSKALLEFVRRKPRGPAIHHIIDDDV